MLRFDSILLTQSLYKFLPLPEHVPGTGTSLGTSI